MQPDILNLKKTQIPNIQPLKLSMSSLSFKLIDTQEWKSLEAFIKAPSKGKLEILHREKTENLTSTVFSTFCS